MKLYSTSRKNRQSVLWILLCLYGLYGCSHTEKALPAYEEYLKISGITCTYVVLPWHTEIFQLEHDSILINGCWHLTDSAELARLNARVTYIDSIGDLNAGVCIDNDAAGIVYKIRIGERTLEWKECFQRSEWVRPEQEEILDMLWEYYQRSRQELYRTERELHRPVRKGYFPPDFIRYPVDTSEKIVSTSYYGIFRNFDFRYRHGQTIFFLIPRDKHPKVWLEEQIGKVGDMSVSNGYPDRLHILEEQLSRQTFLQLSSEFDLYVYHLPKMYMTHTPELDAPYTEKTLRIEYVYYLDTKNNRIEEIDRIFIDGANSRKNCWTWLEAFLSVHYGYNPEDL